MHDGSSCGFVTELRSRGYAVLPAPRQVELSGGQTRLGPDWRLELESVGEGDIAVRTLQDALAADHGFQLEQGGGSASGVVRLTIRAGTVDTADAETAGQAYKLTVASGYVEVVGNAPAGLFYGVQTLLQLLEGNERQTLVLPLGEIRDWPTLPLRIAHWDTKHHQDRLETLRRYIDGLARFKINAVAFELEDKFEYPSHPIIGAPGAFTTDELQSLVRYGLERYVQIIPDIQAPAHMAYVLKHDEFAHLRCDGSNYQACMDDPKALRLIFDMYDDMLKATAGVEYFLVSTDEVYFAGICEKYRRPYNRDNQSATWVEFANKANAYLRERGRRVIMWVEWPLQTEFVSQLSPDIIDGVIGTDDVVRQIEIENQLGMRQLIYASMHGGGARLFPNYFSNPDGKPLFGRLADAYEATLRGKASKGRPIGTFAAAWGDQGLHNEAFWLGWVTMGQYGWRPGGASVQQTVADFMDLFYGRGTCGMVELYHELQGQAVFFESAWDRVPSRERGPAYGSSDEKKPVPRQDVTLAPPALPQLPDLAFEPAFKARYARLLAQAPAKLAANDRLIAGLHVNLTRARRNHYNLHVLLSIAHMQRHFIEMLLAAARAEDLLADASAAHQRGQSADAINLLGRAHDAAARAIADLDEVFGRLTSVWEVSRFAKGRSAGGRHFVHVMDDVKDHPADRRPDLSYLIMAEQSIGLPQWRDALAEIIRGYSAAHGVAATVESPHE